MAEDRYTDAKTNIIYEKMLPVSHKRAHYEGFAPGITMLPKGYQDREGALPFSCDTIYERDVAVTLRDGTTIYADVYRPKYGGPVAAVMSCCWAGKTARHDMWGAALYPNGGGPLDGVVSGRQLWLGLDPAKWVGYGYAVVSVDSRGVYMSEGNVRFPSVAEGQDGYDVVEWIAAQEWCDGKVGMAGQRWTGEMQWFTAAECPPHLVCFAPWDAHGNLYMDEFVRGGIQKARGTTIDRSFGNGYIEAIDDMTYARPLYDDYWKEKTVNFERIVAPAFLLGTYDSKYHTRGNVDAFRRISSTEKWLWLCDFDGYEDYYSDRFMLELKRFLDFYLKGVSNGWETTSPVRMLIMDPGGADVIDRPEKEFPLAKVQPIILYLDTGTMQMQTEEPKEEHSTEYDSENKASELIFRYEFQEEREISGFSKLKLWLSADKGRDMDVFVKWGKMDADGNILEHRGYQGPTSKLRVSHRKTDEIRSTLYEPYHPHDEEELLEPGEIVCAEFDIWPVSMKFHSREKLFLSIAPYGDTGMPPVYEPGWEDVILRNQGIHRVYTGGACDSQLVLPMI